MKMKKLTCCFAFLGVFCCGQALGQAAPTDSAFLAAAANNLSDRYTNAIGDEKPIFNGKEYLNYDKYYLRGHQFYKSDEEQEGEVYYEGYLFTKVPLLYDVVLDQMVVSEPNGSLQFKLENEKTAYFKVHGHTFIRLAADTLGPLGMRTGFYDLLSAGKAKVMAKRNKRFIEQPTPRGMEGEFLIEDKFFIRANDTYYPVSKKKSVLQVFPENKKELQKYIRSQRLKFKKESRETSIVKLAQYYNSLAPPKPQKN